MKREGSHVRSNRIKGGKRSMPLKASGIAVIVAFFMLWVWLWHVPVNPMYAPFWIYDVIPFLLVALLVVSLARGMRGENAERIDGQSLTRYVRRAFICFVALYVLLIVVGSPLFMSRAYASRLTVQESSFDEWSDRLLVEGISLMDTESATRVGNRELGSLSEVVSQYDDAAYYQVIVDGSSQKVSPLQYVSVFSWLNNRDTGTPGYVSVDPIRQNADYHELASIDGTGDGMRYVPSAWFGDNLRRHIWMQYPTLMLGDSHFELDDEGHPFYVTQSFSLAFPFAWGTRSVESIVVTDPTNGASVRYATSDVPSWVDVVYDGDLIDEMYDDYGAWSGGFWNGMLGQIGCTRTGGDYGYVAIDGEQWVYTGVTSMGGDASNIGFLLVSERTGEAWFLPMASADENSAMASAEGKIQQYGYQASFPSLVAIDGQPTYVMVLKDAAGLIRLYAMVNAESYNVVACEADLVTCKSSYEAAMRAAGITFDGDGQEMPEVDAGDASAAAATGGQGKDQAVTNGEAKPYDSVVAATQLADEGGNTYLYIMTADGEVLRVMFAQEPVVCMSVDVGDRIAGEGREGSGEVVDVLSIEIVD